MRHTALSRSEARRSGTPWVGSLALPLTACFRSVNFLISLHLSFLLCKTAIMIVPTLQDYFRIT